MEALLKMSFVHAHNYVSFPNRVGTVLQLELALELEDVGPREAMSEQALVAVKAKTFLSRSCQMPLIPCC